MTDLIGEALAAPVFGVRDLPVHARHHGFDLPVQLGHLLFGGVGGKDVDELVLTVCHSVSFRTFVLRIRNSNGHQVVARAPFDSAQGYSVVAGSPPLY